MKKKCMRGFTLVELLVSVGLMVMLIGIVSQVFKSASTVYDKGVADMRVYANARYALEQLSRDLAGTLHVQSGKQRFNMTNGGSDNFIGAQDKISFTAITSVVGILQPVRVTYSLIPTMDHETKKQKVTVHSKQPIYTLFVEYRDLDGNLLKDSRGKDIRGDRLCEYITSFNLRYAAYRSGTHEFTYFQLDDNPAGVDESGRSYADMLGEGNEIGDGKPETGEPRIPAAIEVSLTVVEDEKERSRRVFVQTISIPVH